MPQIDRIFGASASLALKAPCRTATTAEITLEGEQTVGSVAVVTGDRVLVKNQPDATENGIYLVDTSGWERSPDFDGNRDAVQGTAVLIVEGTNGNTFWQVSTENPIVIGSSEIEFELSGLNTTLAPTLSAFAALAIGADKLPYGTGTDAFALADFPAFARSLVAAASASAARTVLGLIIGTDVQAHDSTIDALAALDTTTGILIQTAADAFTKREILGTAQQIDVTDGDGVAGNPILSFPAGVVFGTNNTAIGTNNSVLSGSSNDISSSGDNNTVVGGQLGVISGTADYAASVGGRNLEVFANHAAGVGGNGNDVGAQYSASVGGNGNGIQSTAVAAGTVGGASMTLTGVNAGTVGGQNGTVSGTNSGILAGSGANVSGATAAAVGGTNATASQTSAATLGGATPTASGLRSVALGGNAITASGTDAAALAGASNTAAGNNSVALGGQGISITSGGTYGLGTGQFSSVTRNGQRSHAAGRFAATGDAQISDFVMRNSTANNTPTELFLDGASARLTIPTDTTWKFRVEVTARRTDADNESAWYDIIGGIDNNSGTVALVGSNVTLGSGEDNAGWDCAVTADNTNDALVLTVTGEAAKTVRWVAHVHLVEVTG